MKTHTSNFKDEIKKLGRQLDSKITYELDGEIIELRKEELNSITPHYEGAILKSTMRQLDIDSNVDIPLETVLTYQFGVKVDGEYEYINFGNYIVYSVEKQEDTNSYKITCYDKMLYSMKEYESIGITYPITIRDYIDAICAHLGLTFKNSGDTFANYNRQIQNELYLDSEGNSLGYTFRDVFDELAQVTASTICVNEEDDELEIRYINDTEDTIDEEFFKNINVNFGEKYGPINTIVLSRSAGADNIYYPATLPEEPFEIKISDNQIMNDNDRVDYLPDIYDKLNGLEYYLNDFSSPGITYYNLCDRYTVNIGETTYSCVMFNDEINVTQGLEENVHTDLPEETVTDYTKADKTDRKINQTYLMVDKQNQEIKALSEKIVEVSATSTGIGSVTLENAYTGTLHHLEITGAISLFFPQDEDYLYGYPLIPTETLTPSNSLIPSNLVPYGNGIKYPSDDLFTRSKILIIDDKEYELDFNFLNYINDSICDKFIYNDGECYIIRKVGIDSEGNKYALDNEIIERKNGVLLEVSSNSTIYLKSFNNAKYSCTYLLNNEYTDNFAPSVDLISQINLSPGYALIEASKLAKITAEKILLEGYISANGNFLVDLEGNMTCQDANINGDIITSKGVLTNLQFSGELWSWFRENVYDSQGGGFIGFNYDDELSSIHKSFLNFTVRIPEHFTVKSAKIHLRHSPVTWYNSSGTLTQQGSCKNVRAYITSNLGTQGYGAYMSEYVVGGNTPIFDLISTVSAHNFSDSSFETYSTEDFKEIFTDSGVYNISVMTTNNIGYTPNINNAYSVLGSQTGIMTGILEIIGYTSNV